MLHEVVMTNTVITYIQYYTNRPILTFSKEKGNITMFNTKLIHLKTDYRGKKRWSTKRYT